MGRSQRSRCLVYHINILAFMKALEKPRKKMIQCDRLVLSEDWKIVCDPGVFGLPDNQQD